MVAVGISYLLYPVYRCGYADDIRPNAWKEIWNNFGRYSNSYLLKIVSEPDFVLLEDQSCATSSQGHDQEVYPLEISLDLVVSMEYIQWRAATRFKRLKPSSRSNSGLMEKWEILYFNVFFFFFFFFFCF